jgi:hypothetical protein
MRFLFLVIAIVIAGIGAWYVTSGPIPTSIKPIPTPVVTVPTATVAALATSKKDNNTRVIRITQDEINQKLRDIGTAQAKVTNVTLSKDSIAIDLLVGGIKGTLTTGLAVANGNIILRQTTTRWCDWRIAPY